VKENDLLRSGVCQDQKLDSLISKANLRLQSEPGMSWESERSREKGVKGHIMISSQREDTFAQALIVCYPSIILILAIRGYRHERSDKKDMKRKVTAQL
jgi:hypothetical protein